MPYRCLFPVPVLFAVLLSCGCLAPGQRYLKIRIERDGELILHTEYGVSDSLNAAAMWQSLRGKPFKAVGTVTAEIDDKQKAVLKGKIRVVIIHVDKEIASAQVDQLQLSRAVGAGEWQLPADEVERTAKAAGL